MASPPITRVMRVLDYLASHPDDGFTVSELARRLSLNKATCHAIVTTLAERRYLTKEASSGRYALGPALIPLGLVAERRFQPLDLAKDELNALADDLGVAVMTSIRDGGEILHLTYYGPMTIFGAMARPGQRLPLVPPLGTTFFAWAPDDVVKQWLAGVDADSESVEAYLESLAETRAAGYVASRDIPSWRSVLTTVETSDLDSANTRRAIETQIGGTGLGSYLLTPEGEADVASVRSNAIFIAAPVFDPVGDVRLAVTVHLPDSSSVTIDEAADRLLNLTSHMTVAIGGHIPLRQDRLRVE